MTLTWPAGTPQQIYAQLVGLQAADQLSGVAPQILSAICRYTSDWGLQGLAVNATGFGGYFGQHVGWEYPTRPQGFSAAVLTTPRTFPTQAKAAAATLAGYGLPLAHALAEYVSGTRNQTEDGFVVYVLESTGATPNGTVAGTPAPLPVQLKEETMAAAIGTGLIAVDGVTTEGHKVVCTVPIGDRQTPKAWSIMDLTDAGTAQGVTGLDFTS